MGKNRQSNDYNLSTYQWSFQVYDRTSASKYIRYSRKYAHQDCDLCSVSSWDPLVQLRSTDKPNEPSSHLPISCWPQLACTVDPLQRSSSRSPRCCLPWLIIPPSFSLEKSIVTIVEYWSYERFSEAESSFLKKVQRVVRAKYSPSLSTTLSHLPVRRAT